MARTPSRTEGPIPIGKEFRSPQPFSAQRRAMATGKRGNINQRIAVLKRWRDTLPNQRVALDVTRTRLGKNTSAIIRKVKRRIKLPLRTIVSCWMISIQYPLPVMVRINVHARYRDDLTIMLCIDRTHVAM
jgi:hypothetical protein